MSIFYLDLEGGNDANDGTTFANRWKTFTNGPTSARINAGDTVRVMASPPPWQPSGITATWTENTSTVTLSGNVVTDIADCETAWTSSTNVTSTADTTYYRSGTKSAKLAIAAAFTTGKVAYFPLSALNLTNNRYLSLYIRTDTQITTGQLSIRLCSDGAGATTVRTFNIAANTLNGADPIGAGVWHMVLLDCGQAIGSGINSIALYCDADLSTTAAVTIWLDNIVSPTGTSADTSQLISHRTLIGLPSSTGVAGGDGSESWYPILSIVGTTITLDRQPTSSSPVAGKYGNATQTGVSLWCRNPLLPKCTPSGTSYLLQAAKSGAADSRIMYSGGWNRTDMSTQTDETWIDGVNCVSYGFYTANYNSIEHFGMARCNYGFYFQNNTNGDQIHAVGCSSSGIQGSGTGIYINAHSANCNASSGVYMMNGWNKAWFKQCNGNGTGAYAQWSELHGGVCKSNTNYGLQCGGVGHFFDITTKNNVSSAYFGGSSGPHADQSLVRCVFNESSEFGNLGGDYNSRICSVDHDGTIGYNVIASDGAKAETDTGITHGGTASWKLSVTSTNRRLAYPFDLKIATIAVKAGQAVTVSAWLRRTSTTITAQLWARAEPVPFQGGATGVGATMSAGANTWEQLSVSFTPTETGTVDIYVYAYGGTTDSVWVDDLTMTGAANLSDLQSLDIASWGRPLGAPALAPAGGNVIVIDD